MSARQFDREYVKGLVEGDPETIHHFTHHFGRLMLLATARHRAARSWWEDVRQETFIRVWKQLRDGGGLEYPERLGAFVYSVFRKVIAERVRTEQRQGAAVTQHPADEPYRLDAALVTVERRQLIENLLAELHETERTALKMIFLDECDRAEVCKRLGVSPDYLRVIVHRAIQRFRAAAGPECFTH